MLRKLDHSELAFSSDTTSKILFIIQCMWMKVGGCNMCVFVLHVCEYASVCVHVCTCKAKVVSIVLPYGLETGSFYWVRGRRISQAGWLVSSLIPPNAGVIGTHSYGQLFMWCLGLNSGPFACRKNVLTH